MKIKLMVLPLLASSLLISLPAFADLKDIGRQDANGLYEPGYVNYQHARERSSTPNQGSNLFEIGYKNASSHYEPSYVNYRAPERKPADSKTKLEQLSDIGHFNNQGIYEPGYVNYDHTRK
ncbi:hypothetical protein [Photobacterium lipolyticum]|uniref:Uncharacterized protein n=1 Tax=Photobacterium lipolyticum TaxID=266810 RepID=A0A2T3MZ45_9GAMM|nr:hypothetical protein [Photobacterium lipolyticum]PSW05203.1 hypothetical protein C9I89_10500 [Photobacterium lipolyticum]